VSSRRLADLRLGRRHLVNFRRFINALARLPLDGTRSAWAGRTAGKITNSLFFPKKELPIHVGAFTFERMVDHSALKTRHCEACSFQIYGLCAPCSICAGAMTFQTAENLANGFFQTLPAPLMRTSHTGKAPISKSFFDIHPSTMLGFFNIAQIFGFTRKKAGLNASFGTGQDGEGSRHCNVIWGTYGLIS
jgi:hypothetical protein